MKTKIFFTLMFVLISYIGYCQLYYPSTSTTITGSNVGIGVSTPTNILSLGNNQAQTIWIENTANTVAGKPLTLQAGSTVTGGTSDLTGGNLILNSGLGKGTGASNIVFSTGKTLTTGSTLQTMTEAMRISGQGYVGIGTTSPSVRLYVAGTDYYSSQTIFQRSSSLGWGPGLNLYAISSDGSYIQSGRALGGLSFFGEYNGDSNVGTGAQINAYTTQDFNLGYGSKLQFYTTANNTTSNQIRMVIDNNGYVGIGQTTPGASLEVDGSSGTTLKIVDGNQVDGYVLTSNAAGVASWASPVTSGTAWQLTGNTVIAAGKYMGTNDNFDVVFKRYGTQAGLLSTTNTFWGVGAGNDANASGINNIFVGNNAGTANTYAKDNVAIGVDALSTQSYANGNTAWSTFNVAVGNGALFSNNPTSNYNGYCNVAVGYQSLYYNNIGFNNTATGYKALYNNTTGTNNTATGFGALSNNSSGSLSTAVGMSALEHNTTGSGNTANGYYSLNYNTTGIDNTAIGVQSIAANTEGYYNTALGYYAGYNYPSTGHDNTYLGYSALSSNNYSGSTAIGSGATVSNNNYIVMGTAAIQRNGGYQPWYNFSDGRFKTNVQENVKGLEFINKLRPVTYHMNAKMLDDFINQNLPDSIKTMRQNGIDFNPATAMVHSGFIAQEVEQAALECGFQSTIVSPPANSTDPYALAYAEIVVPLVKSVQELSKTTDSLKIHQKMSDSLNAIQAGIQATTINSLLIHQATTDSLLTVLQNCCSLGALHKTIQNNDSQGQNNSETSLQIELANNSQPILYQNEPNPFGVNTVIRYFIPENTKGNAYIIFYDMYGKELKKTEISTKGFGNIDANTEKLASGIYSYSLIVNAQVIDTKKMIKQ